MALLILKLKDRELSRLPISKVRVTIGRDDTNDMPIDNLGVSRVHATVEWDSGLKRFVVSDNESANGIFVRGQKVTRTVLNDGDDIVINKFTVVFSLKGGVPPEQLEGAGDPRQVEGPRSPNPTTHLTLDDLNRVLHSMGKPGATPPAREVIRHDGRFDELERQAKTLRWVAVGLAVIVTALVGVMVWLLVLRD